jgi:preprotein translocase subunit SecG
MYVFIIFLHVIVSFIMVGVILLQAGKGAEMGAAFGGSSQTIFGSRGPGTFLSKMTAAAAVIFMITSLSLSVLSKGRFMSTSVLDLKKKEAPAATAPAETPTATSPVPTEQAPTKGQESPPAPNSPPASAPKSAP